MNLMMMLMLNIKKKNKYDIESEEIIFVFNDDENDVENKENKESDGYQ